MVTIEAFSHMVSTVYDAAITPGNWAAAMAEICGALDAQGAAMVVADGTERMIQSASGLETAAGMAYAEYYSTPVYWPDFDEHELRRALDAYAGRDRRFGRVPVPAETATFVEGASREVAPAAAPARLPVPV